MKTIPNPVEMLRRLARKRRDRGATDPILVIAAIAVSLVLLVGGGFAVAGLVNNAHDLNAQAMLDKVATAETSVYAAGDSYWVYDSHKLSTYRALEQPDKFAPNGGVGFTPASDTRTIVDVDGKGWVATSYSATGKVYIRTSASPNIVLGDSTTLGAAGLHGGFLTSFNSTGVVDPGTGTPSILNSMKKAIDGAYPYDFTHSHTIAPPTAGLGIPDEVSVPAPTPTPTATRTPTPTPTLTPTPTPTDVNAGYKHNFTKVASLYQNIWAYSANSGQLQYFIDTIAPMKSTDGGATWTKVSYGCATADAAALDNGGFYDESGGRVFSTCLGNDHTVPMPSGLPKGSGQYWALSAYRAVGGNDVGTGLAASGDGKHIIDVVQNQLALNSRGLLISNDSGATGTFYPLSFTCPMGVTQLQCGIWMSHDGSTVVVRNGGTDSYYVSHDGGATGTIVTLSGSDGGQSAMRNVSISATGATIAIGTDDGKIAISKNGGAFSFVNGPEKTVAAVKISANGQRLVMAGPAFAYTSSDGGATWVKEANITGGSGTPMLMGPDDLSTVTIGNQLAIWHSGWNDRVAP